MGWFTSNMPSQPNLYPTQKNYEKEKNQNQSKEQQAENQPKTYPTKLEYSSEVPHSSLSNQNSQNQIQNKHLAKQIVKKLQFGNFLISDLLKTLESNSMICGLMNKELHKCIKSANRIDDIRALERLCKNQLQSYKMCLETVDRNQNQTN